MFEVTVQRLSSVKISLLATSILFQANAKFNCTKGLELLAVDHKWKQNDKDNVNSMKYNTEQFRKQIK